jgi:hypothetical protein
MEHIRNRHVPRDAAHVQSAKARWEKRKMNRDDGCQIPSHSSRQSLMPYKAMPITALGNRGTLRRIRPEKGLSDPVADLERFAGKT